MHSDSMIRLVLVVLMVSDLSMPSYFRRRAAAKAGAAPRHRTGRLLMPERLLTLAVYCGIIAHILSPSLMAWSRIDSTTGVRALGVGLAALGLAGLCWAFRHLDANLIADSVPGADHTLVTSGPYRWIRHPLYSAWGVLMLGYGLATSSWAVILVAIAALGTVVRRTSKEEEALIAQFGAAYRTYAARTGRFLPQLRRSR